MSKASWYNVLYKLGHVRFDKIDDDKRVSDTTYSAIADKSVDDESINDEHAVVLIMDSS